ncbi:MAG: hypothetical protein LHV69_03345 [Elusimicrobia bacterium]|nr:hypothetical protein [Candidatus Obscuribacterium magneticum]
MEYTTDLGPINVSTFTYGQWGTITVNQDFAASDAPEGIKVQQNVVGAGGGGWYLLNTVGWNDWNVVLRDFSAYDRIRFWLKSSAAVAIEIEYQTGASPVNVSSSIASTGNTWREFIIPLGTGGFGLTLVQMQNIRAPFKFTSAAAGTWYIDHVRWTKPLTNILFYPTSTQVNPNRHRQFTVEGRNTTNELVIVYPQFPATSAGTIAGTIGATGKSRSIVLTASGASGNITASDSGINRTAGVTITSNNLDSTFGLLSETIPGAIIDTDSKLFMENSADARQVEVFDEINSDNREGLKRFKTIVHPAITPGSTNWTGWFIQWGFDGSSTTTVDMSNYYDGSIRFWFKGPPALATKLEVGVRSSNVPEGSLSKTLLRNYVAFDNVWRPVVIPISLFAKPPPYADLSRIKVLFSVFALGDTGLTDQTFYIDNLRWDTRIPGPVASVTVSPSSTTIPTNASRQFVASAVDAANVSVDMSSPIWNLGNACLGTLVPKGPTAILNSGVSLCHSMITVSSNAVSATSDVTIIDYVPTQTFNVYSDAGAGGGVGVAHNPETSFGLSEPNDGTAPEGVKFMRSTYTLVNTPGQTNAYGLWFVESVNFPQFMSFYSPSDNGYLQFYVRSSKDLTAGIRSNNIAAGTERSKVTMSELGLVLDGVTWNKVFISMDFFARLEPLLDFSQIKTFFYIGPLVNQAGLTPDQQFDVDNVKWMTNSPRQPDVNKVYQGLVVKQEPSGLVRSYDALPQSVTYDNAIAAMNFTYRKDLYKAQAVFNVYKAKYGVGGGFAGFHDEYDVTAPGVILDADRLAGPNAWMLLALEHYRSVTSSTTYDAMMNGIASWLKNNLQSGDGGVQFGYVNNVLQTSKSTEHNFDCYAAFKAYARIFGDTQFDTAANNVLTWLTTNNKGWNAAEGRFNVGTDPGGNADPRKALDAYSWAPLALSGYSSLLPLAEVDFSTHHVCDRTGVDVTGFDFVPPASVTPDKVAVWLEGTGQMALAYLVSGSTLSWRYYLQEIEKAVSPNSPTSQGIPYATNAGTGFGGFTMDSLHPAVSAMGWYLFANNQFNPFKPVSDISVELRNISNDQLTNTIGWTVSAPAGWTRADQYILLRANPVSWDPWGVQIYTDNQNGSHPIRYVDPTSGDPHNIDSDPAGLLLYIVGHSTTSTKLSLAWSINDLKIQGPLSVDMDACPRSPAFYQWNMMRDYSSPSLVLDGRCGGVTSTTAFARDGDFDSSLLLHQVTFSGHIYDGIHYLQGPSFSTSYPPDYIFLQANFGSAAAQSNYQAPIIIEYYSQ